MSQDAFRSLMDHTRQIEALSQVGMLLSWDQEAMMPPDGAEQRSEQMAALETVSLKQKTDPKIGEWLIKIDRSNLSSEDRRQLEIIEKDFARSQKTPPELAEALARTTSRAQHIWAKAREDDDVKAFLPILTEIVSLKREFADAVKGPGESLYDALLEDFEPGTKSAEVATIFSKLRPGLSLLREKVSQSHMSAPVLTGRFPHASQLELSKKVSEIFNYKFSAGRMDTVVHPFCTGTGGDVRITTRIDEAEPLGCLYSVIHEVGHALYEQNMAPHARLTPLAHEASMGVHESQSRMMENQIGRSRAFCAYLFPLMKSSFPDFDLPDANSLYRAINRVETGFIRTEADELHYNLHVMLRFELELDLIEGRLETKDLEEAWNSRFLSDFGRAVDKPSNGVLQDVHWSVGLFGYFPTYTLGNIYAGCLFEKIRSEIPNLDQAIERGELAGVVSWLNEKIHAKGKMFSPPALIESATGAAPSELPLLKYLEQKFSDLYAL